ncbi:MBL fold metallo-hydrolase [Aureimonas sp. Leaf454]|uniref:MBL fold metallo-hydrolase n=1 Tax=Aureimonas sp. Leaf454 TaxID=1736381 RepID=UPI0006F9A431|nr:MBL fold metallo-hydrolase [Aureimonas sp. Leaf454]KQT44540.1 MBL fold metallo-hydrolase [Aureimonas sp. Leaf454]
MTISRRNAIKLAAASSLSAGAILAGSGGSAMAQTAPNAAVPAADREQRPGWHRVAIGDAIVTVVLDGLRPGDGPHPTFGENQSAEAVATLMRENFLPETRFVNGFNPALVEIGDMLVLFDTGMGAMGRANGLGKLVERMGAAGYAPGDVDLVVLTHMHGDHIGGLMEEGQPTFPNARYMAGQVEYDFWTSAEAKAGPRAENAKLVEARVVPLKDKITFLKEGAEVVPGITAHEAFGHSPGHMIFKLVSGGQTLWLTADTANHFVASLQRPDWEVRFDMDKAEAVATRKRVFGAIAESRAPFLGYHMPFPGIGYVESSGEGFRFVPASYQFDV